MPNENATKLIGEAVDRLITVDVSSRGLIQILYNAAREKLGNGPLTLLAAVSGDLNVLHSPETELNVIRACTDAGALDGLTGFVEPLVDFVSAKICANMIEILQTIIRNALNLPMIFR